MNTAEIASIIRLTTIAIGAARAMLAWVAEMRASVEVVPEELEPQWNKMIEEDRALEAEIKRLVGE